MPFKLGSPPRMRGKGLVGFELDIRIRITPACAGKSLSPAPEKALPGDHPRMCGEKFNCNPGSPQHWGSPPHMRGKAKIFRRWSAEMGITPAYAGKSIQTFQFVQYHRDHPRVCGEKLSISSAHISQTGSPPRMRGKAPGFLCSPYFPGITPACAGKRLRAVTICCAIQDHPRVCGEKPTQRSTGSVRPGSPPRVRGKGSAPPRGHPLPGITPACAGKSPRALTRRIMTGDHPRVCGEKKSGMCL